MESIGDRSLGPVRVDLGRMKPEDRSTLLMILWGIISVLAVVLIVVGIYVIIRMQLDSEKHAVGGSITAALGWGIGGIAVVGGLIILGLVILRLFVERALTVTIHEGGLAIGRSWFRRLHVAWPHVAGFAPPEPGAAKSECWLLLRDGRRILIERLSLPSIRDHAGQVVPHADVRIVIDHFLDWQRTHGVR